MKTKMGILGGTALAAILAVTGLGFGAVAGAQTPTAQTPPAQPANRPVHVTGQVTQVGANNLQLRTMRGPVSAIVGPNTWIVVQRDRQCVEGRLQDIQTQRPATIWGTTTDQQGQINARMIVQGRCMGAGPGADRGRPGNPGNPPNRPNPPGRVEDNAALGTIKSISGSNIVVATPRGADATIVTTADTLVVNNGFQAISSLKVGDRIGVIGSPAQGNKPVPPAQRPAARTINAWGIRVMSDSTRLVMGRIESVSGNSAKLNRPGDRDGLTVNFDAATQFKSVALADGRATVANAALADVKAGSVLTVEGVLSADGNTLQAKSVIIMPVRPNRPAQTTP